VVILSTLKSSELVNLPFVEEDKKEKSWFLKIRHQSSRIWKACCTKNFKAENPNLAVNMWIFHLSEKDGWGDKERG